jgi:uncharacterized membrane protein (UPF0127 family)
VHLDSQSGIMNLVRRLLTRPNKQQSARLCVVNRTREIQLAHSIEVADEASTRRKGLLGRMNLAAGEGLWIVPCEAVHTFGMKFPIDLVFLDRNKIVKKVKHNVVPGRLSMCLSAHSVLELASGAIQSTGTLPGDKLEFGSAA